MPSKKKLRALLDGVAHLFDTPLDRKKLKKAKAFAAFLDELRERRGLLADGAASTSDPVEAAMLAGDVEYLDDQIARAERLLQEL